MGADILLVGGRATGEVTRSRFHNSSAGVQIKLEQSRLIFTENTVTGIFLEEGLSSSALMSFMNCQNCVAVEAQHNIFEHYRGGSILQYDLAKWYSSF